MVDSNIQRENILPTERGFAYKLKLDAMKHQGKRSDITSTQVGQKLKKSIQLNNWQKMLATLGHRFNDLYV